MLAVQLPVIQAIQEHSTRECRAQGTVSIVRSRNPLQQTRLGLQISCWDTYLWHEGTRMPPWLWYQHEQTAGSLNLYNGPLQSHDSFMLWSPRKSDELHELCVEGNLDGVLDVLSSLNRRGTAPSVNVYRSILKACVKRKALPQARRLRALLTVNGLQSNVPLGECLVSVLVDCGGLEDALSVFHELPRRTVLSWTAVISGHCTSEQGQQGLEMYHKMQNEGVEPNAYTLAGLLRACGQMGNLEAGKKIYAEALKYDWVSSLFVQTSLLNMYVKCGSIRDAQIVFDGLSGRNVVSWTMMLAAYSHDGQAGTTLQLYESMLEEGISPDDRAFVILLQACGMVAEHDRVIADGSGAAVNQLGKGKVLHADAWRKRYVTDSFVENTLVSMYCKCGSLSDAQRVFDNLHQRDFVSWSALLGAYAQQGEAEKALELYEVMLEEGVSPNLRTLVSLLQACAALLECREHALVTEELGILKVLHKVKAIHADACRKGCTSNVFFENTLIGLYGKCGSIVDAQNVFDDLLVQDVVSWTVLISAYVEQGNGERALQLYETMREEGWSPDDRAFVSVLQACSTIAETAGHRHSIRSKTLEVGKALHADAWMMGRRSDVFVASSLITVYGKCGSIVDAENVFSELSHRTLVAWNAILSVYVEHGKGKQALELYCVMQERCVAPNKITFLCMLQACSQTGSLDICGQIHRTLVAMDYDLTLDLGNALIHAYGCCASLVDAQAVFDLLSRPDVVSWTALLAAYARQGQSVKSFECYSAMQLAGVQPNEVTFLLLLNASSHSGMIGQGVEYFESMVRDYGISPGPEHYACLVSMLGRAGYLASARHLLQTIPLQPNLTMWLCLMDACRAHGMVNLGEEAFDQAVSLEPEHGAAYALLSNIYTDAGRWSCALKVQERRRIAGACREPGHSWIEHEQKLPAFFAGD